MEVIQVEVLRRADKDLVVRLTRDDGRSVEVAGEDYYAEGQPFRDAFDVWAFLIWQEPPLPAPLIQGALDAFDPRWEDLVAARTRANDEQSARKRGEPTRREVEDERRARLKEEFRRSHGA